MSALKFQFKGTIQTPASMAPSALVEGAFIKLWESRRQQLLREHKGDMEAGQEAQRWAADIVRKAFPQWANDWQVTFTWP